MSDSNYAVGLAEKFDYQNTYFHRSPHLDIAADLTEAQMGLYDFVISSEIFEHVLPPVDHAFRNVHRLLKPGGLLILTVPYGLKADTTEHFPQLHDFTITGDGDHRILTNRTRTGEIEKFENLVFHGGVGATLEMRVFCEQDLVRRLVQAGFSEITLHQESVLEYGIVWPQLWSRPISAVKPSSLSASEQAA
ncbi:MAG: methyltransferase domain-containing protein [Chthoniobacterales bacterium]